MMSAFLNAPARAAWLNPCSKYGCRRSLPAAAGTGAYLSYTGPAGCRDESDRIELLKSLEGVCATLPSCLLRDPTVPMEILAGSADSPLVFRELTTSGR